MHMDILKSLEAANPQGYEKVMVSLYSLARNNQGFPFTKQGSIAGFIDVDSLGID
jgi:hypothetical protein